MHTSVIPKQSIAWVTDNNGFSMISICPSKMPPIKTFKHSRRFKQVPLEHECRLRKDKLGRYYLIVPLSAGVDECSIENKDGIIALDLGIRTFLTGYSTGVCMKIGDGDYSGLMRLLLWLDKLRSKIEVCKNSRNKKNR